MSRQGDERGTEPQDDEINALVGSAKAGDQGAKAIVVERFKSKLYWVATAYGWSKADIADLVSAGQEGLLKGIGRFDPTRGHAFWTFAKYWVKKEVFLEACRHSGLPPSLAMALNRVRKAEEMLWQELGREATREEVFKKVVVGDPFYEPPTEEYAKRLRVEMLKLEEAYEYFQSSAWRPPGPEEDDNPDWIAENVPQSEQTDVEEMDPLRTEPLVILGRTERRGLKRRILMIMETADPPTYAAIWGGRKVKDVARELGISEDALKKRVERLKKSVGLHFGDGGPAHRAAGPGVRGCAYHDMCCVIERLLAQEGEGYDFLEVMRGG